MSLCNVPIGKIVNYLLDKNNPGKSSFFIGRGFHVANPDELVDTLERHWTDHHAGARCIVTPFGVKFVMIGPLETPKGLARDVLSCWIKEFGDSVPRLVTAYKT